MSDAGVHNPFQPGHGGLPPYLAGREREQALFRGVLGDLRSGVPVPRSVVLYGPRGNGKTALLAWVQREAESDDGLEARWLTGASVPAPEALVRRLQLSSLFGRLSADSISFGGVGVSLRQGEDYPPLEEALEARAKTKPLLILLDEAHTLRPEVGQWLLNAAQTAGRRAPFLLVLAGTPDLRARLSEMGASFWNRAKKLPVSRLDETATAEAIRHPLADHGITVEKEALEHMVRESHGYPFFVQLWGQAVWNGIRRSPEGANTVTTAVTEEAAGEFEAERNDYYIDRFRELEKRGLLRAAREVATAFGDGGPLSNTAFRRAIARSGGDGPGETEAAETLEHLGFVWQTRGVPTWEPGIPSLMDYILEHAPPPNASDAPGR